MLLPENFSKRSRYLIVAFIFLGVPIFVYSLFATIVQAEISWLLLAVATVLASLFPVRLPNLKTKVHSLTVTASDIFVFGALLLFSPETAITLSGVDAIVGNVKTKHLHKMLFNVGVPSLALFSSGHLFYWMQNQTPPLIRDRVQSLPMFLLELALAVSIYFLITTGAASLVISSITHSSWRETWQSNFFWSSITNFTAAGAAAGFFFGFDGNVLLAVGGAAPIVLVLYYSYRMNHDRLKSVQDSQVFLQSTLDSLSSDIGIVDPEGVLVAVNADWGGRGPGTFVGSEHLVGSNYLDSCRRVVGRLQNSGLRLATAIESVLRGELESQLIEYSTFEEGSEQWFAARVTRFNSDSQVRAVVAHENITELRRAEEKIIRLAYYDDLTDLPNRAFLKEHAQKTVDRAKRYNRKVAALSIDVDHFKRVNDSLGHSAGDQLLDAVGKRFNSCLRRSDHLLRSSAPLLQGSTDQEAPPTIARTGGDEFVVLLTEISEAEDAGRVAERMAESLEDPFQIDGHNLSLTASIGICVYPLNCQDAESLLKDADAALHHAKESGRNNYKFYSESMNRDLAERLALESDLGKALKKGEFELYYQPKIALSDNRVTGVEALIRWNHPNRGLIPPGAFIPLAEKNGFIIPLGEWILQEACRQNRVWQNEGRRLRVAVNLSARQFKQTDLLESVRGILKASRMDPSLLELEVTESVLADDIELSCEVLAELKKLGIHIALDDFGTGYSSLTYLKSLPIDTLKIDRSFVSDISSDSDSKAIVAAITALSKQLGLNVVAEGVETKEQLALVEKYGCDELQGFLYSRPVPAAELVTWLSNWNPNDPQEARQNGSAADINWADTA